MRQDWDDESTEPATGVTASWAAVFRDVRTLAVDLTVAGANMARQVPRVPMPPITELTTGWTRIEDAVLREIKNRLDQVDATGDHRPHHGHAAGGRKPTPGQLLDDLLGASIDADSAGSRDELYRALLLRLVPDEARILAALSDGTPYPLVHVQARANGGRTVLSNASSVGRAAGVQVPDAVSTYVAHLRALGLAEEGPSDDSQSVQYDILLGEPEVRAAEEEARDAGRLGARVVRRTLRISPLGRELWKACRPDDLPEPGPESVSDADLLDSDGVARALGSAASGLQFNPDTGYRPDSGSLNGSHTSGVAGR
ncbi:Abi-alpha family protein [Pseudonocardia sp. Cha107L01]|uniref:Abi-alpha family protein n=1 Tax=Pseudonocardia sp. Cha107L01 TaxID=3457576 RepID=UPI00403EBDD6